MVGFADSKIKVFSARTGVLTRTLVGHESGVWGLCLVSSGGVKLVNTNKSKGKRRTTTSEEDDVPGTGLDQGKYPDMPSNLCFASQGWGQPNSLIVSGGCDKVVRVWDVQSG